MVRSSTFIKLTGLPVAFLTMNLTHSFRNMSLGAVAAIALLLSACASEPGSSLGDENSSNSTEAPSAEPPQTTAESDNEGTAATGKFTATVSVGERNYSFEPTNCLVNDEDAVVSGPGADAVSGELAYLSIDLFTASEPYEGEVRIDLGTDQAFESSDDIIAAFIGAEHGSMYVRTADDAMLLTVQNFHDGNGDSLGPGRVMFNCASR